ncbi:MAG: branched-chain amino acid ABC transporter permease [Acidovorax sp.]|uniref:branched-chain amino acid ABC transporter permease n=1 Tax=Acidovorax sp. TaxID=1872122 RepID=UPI00391A59FC
MFTLPIFYQVLVNGLTLSSIYVLIALGFTLLFGIMKVVNFAHGAFAMLGGYALLYAFDKFKLPFVVAIVLAPLAVALAALVLERLVFRHFYQRMLQSMIGLLGLDLAIVYTAVLIWDSHERSIAPALEGVIKYEMLMVPANRLMIVVVAAVTLAVFWWFMAKTKHGLSMRAASQDLEIAQTQGVNVRTIYVLAFFIAIFMSALAGALWAQTYVLSPFMGSRPVMVSFIVVILGGMGSIPGAALGGLLLGFGESILSTFWGAAVSQFVSFGVVITLLVFRPWGLLGKPE